MTDVNFSSEAVAELAIEMAEEYGFDVAMIKGSGRHGKITKPDVISFVQALKDGTKPEEDQTEEAPEAEPEIKEAPLKNKVLLNFKHDGEKYAAGDTFKGDKALEKDFRKKGLIA